MDQTTRLEIAPKLEKKLISLIRKNESQGTKKGFFNLLISTYQSRKIQDKLFMTWKFEKEFHQLKLSSTDFTNIAMTLAIREYPPSGEILKIQKDRLNNPDKQAELDFLMPVASITLTCIIQPSDMLRKQYRLCDR